MDILEQKVRRHAAAKRRAAKDKRIRASLSRVFGAVLVAIVFVLIDHYGLALPQLTVPCILCAAMVACYRLGRCVRFGKAVR